MTEIHKSVFDLYEMFVGPLSRERGMSQNVLCFAHVDTTPSLRLDGEQNLARCYSCRRTWTPEQMEAFFSGGPDVSKLERREASVLAATFETELLHKIREKKLNPVDFIDFFKALDVARETVGITYESVHKLWRLFIERTEELSNGESVQSQEG